ncbi:BolA family protein [Aquamicrobium segne]|uniref:BolA family protein n=1 Tax=Aquamicrobium segne TaxID=469547 RepID=A0ABW0H1I8_9HYPH
MSRVERIEKQLTGIFAPERLAVIDESHLHAGHQPGFDGSGATHIRVRIVSSAFTGKSRVERHRAVNAALAAEVEDGLHALALETAAPGETVRW